jgi:hypothetical protein
MNVTSISTPFTIDQCPIAVVGCGAFLFRTNQTKLPALFQPRAVKRYFFRGADTLLRLLRRTIFVSILPATP